MTPVSILYKSIAGRYRPVRVADGQITARYRFIKNASWDRPKAVLLWFLSVPSEFEDTLFYVCLTSYKTLFWAQLFKASLAERAR